MQKIGLYNAHALMLACAALCMNMYFLYQHNNHIFFTITQAHGHVGYHLYTYNELQLSDSLQVYMEDAMQKEGQLIDYDRVRGQDFGPRDKVFPINDTVGYGILLGLLWKITRSLLFFDVQVLQIIVFSFLMLIYYQVAYFLFHDRRIAFFCGMAQLMFFPLLAYNVMPVRDVWAYYGLLVLLYAAIGYLYKHCSYMQVLAATVFGVICLWMRPTLCLSILLLSFVILLICYKKRSLYKEGMTLIATLWAISSVLFWVPFVYFNLANYGRCMVSPAGQSMLEGLGEIENPWGHRLNDEYVAEYIHTKYGYNYGTPDFDDAAMQEFKMCVKERPWHYAKTLIYRVPDIILPGLQWIFYTRSPYQGLHGIQQKIMYALSSFSGIMRLLLRQVYMRLYLVFGYYGLFILFRKKRYEVLLYILACIASGWITFPSHIEYRYIVPFYWAFSFCVGYALWYCYTRYVSHSTYLVELIHLKK